MLHVTKEVVVPRATAPRSSRDRVRAHRAELRRQGLPLTEVAARTGFHEGSVRRILRRLASELAIRPRTTPTDSDSAIGVM